jgi:hypothetical protein
MQLPWRRQEVYSRYCTIRKYLPTRLNPGRGKRATTQRWGTFVRNHARAIVACDFCVVVTATFHLLYVFVVMEHGTAPGSEPPTSRDVPRHNRTS